MKKITIIYPSLFGEVYSPWKEELEIAKEVGINTETFDETDFSIRSNLSDCLVIYRGWMISQKDYLLISKSVENKGGVMLIPQEQFRKANTFSCWYQLLERYTMTSNFVRDLDTLDDYFVDDYEWFVKDELKSLGSEKSIATSKDEAIDIYEKIKGHRDFEIENNGICLREVVDITDEERFFILNGKIIGKHDNEKRISFVKNIADKLYTKLSLLFVVIDVGTVDDKNKLVEVGGFQVSDMSKEGDTETIKFIYESINKEFM